MMPPAESPAPPLQVLLFSTLKEKLGQSAVAVHLAMPTTGCALLDHLADRYPAVQAYRSVIRLAVNQEYVPETHVVQEGDEIALITPVSGG